MHATYWPNWPFTPHSIRNNFEIFIKLYAFGRIVVVASTLSEKGRINFDDLLLEKEDPDKSKIHAYGNSKLANIVFAKELSERLVGSGVNVYALCPGWVKTDLARYMQLRWWNYFLIVPAAFLFMRSPGQANEIQWLMKQCFYSSRILIWLNWS